MFVLIINVFGLNIGFLEVKFILDKFIGKLSLGGRDYYNIKNEDDKKEFFDFLGELE